jgi:hypothetical protein
MKKIIFALVMLLLASPAWADVIFTCEQVDVNELVISYDARTETELPRAFGLDIQGQSDANIIEVTGLSPDYIIYPGSIQIDAGGNVTDYGSIACSASYPGTLPGIDSNGVTIECGSLYAPAGSPANAPDPCGPLVSVKIESGIDACFVITGNVVRAGSGGVVLEDPAVDPAAVTFPPPAECCIVGKIPTCMDADQCAGHAQGDASCDGSVNLADLMALKAAWGKSAPWTDPDCCADFDNSGAVNLADLMALKAGWGTTGHTPSTLNQTCP